ncbi:MAG: hypothetical protein V1712_03160 [Patescibacteria group bacterium]
MVMIIVGILLTLGGGIGNQLVLKKRAKYLMVSDIPDEIKYSFLSALCILALIAGITMIAAGSGLLTHFPPFTK